MIKIFFALMLSLFASFSHAKDDQPVGLQSFPGFPNTYLKGLKPETRDPGPLNICPCLCLLTEMKGDDVSGEQCSLCCCASVSVCYMSDAPSSCVCTQGICCCLAHSMCGINAENKSCFCGPGICGTGPTCTIGKRLIGFMCGFLGFTRCYLGTDEQTCGCLAWSCGNRKDY